MVIQKGLFRILRNRPFSVGILMKKSITSFLLCIILICSCFPICSAKETEKTTLYDFYKSNMLFKQNDDAIFAGTAPYKSKISVELKNSKNEIIATGENIADKNNEFSVSFTAPNGSYEEYTVYLYENGKELVILLDGVSGYPSSFLDEAIGELVYDFSLEIVKSILSFETVMFRRRAKQVLEETYPQWEEKRVRNLKVVHSANISQTLKKLDDNKKIVEYTIG